MGMITGLEHICAFEWWAHMHRFLSVRPSETVKLIGHKGNVCSFQRQIAFLSPPVLMHSGLLCIAFCLSVDKKSLEKSHISKSIIDIALKLYHNILRALVHPTKILATL